MGALGDAPAQISTHSTNQPSTTQTKQSTTRYCNADAYKNRVPYDKAKYPLPSVSFEGEAVRDGFFWLF